MNTHPPLNSTRLISGARLMPVAAIAGWMALLTQFAAPSAFAAGPYYWDNNGTTAGFGTAGGTWAAPTVSQWSIDSTGVAAPGASVTTATTDTSENFGTATLGLGAGAVTVSGAVSSGPIVFGAASGIITIITNTSGSSITLPAAATITVNNTKDTISAPLAGAATSLTLGGGNLVISNTTLPASTYSIASGAILELTAPTVNPLSSATTFNGTGTLKFDGGGNGVIIFNASGNDTVALSAGGLVQVSSNTTVTGSSGYHGIWSANLGSLQVDSGSTINFVETGGSTAGTVAQFDALNGGGTISMGYQYFKVLSIGNANGSGAFSGVLKDAGSPATLCLLKNGTGTEILSGNSTYTAGTTNSAGILEVDSNAALGTGLVTLNGGTLSNNVSATLANTVNLNSASTPIGVGSGQTFTLAGAITNAGAITKTGAGTLVLTGANTYTGQTTVNAGELDYLTSSAGASPINVTAAAGATNGVILLSPGGQWVNSGSVTNQNSSVFHVNFSSFSPSTTVAPMSVANLSLGSSLTMRIDGSPGVFFAGQSYPLVTWTGSGPANATGFSTLVLPAGVSGNLSVVNNNTLVVTVSANTSQLTWNTGSGNWDTATANWLSNGIAAKYVDATSAVILDDATSASGNPVITLAAGYSPAGVLMKSTSHNYFIASGNAIASGTSLILDPANTMTLTLSNVNTYTGGTTIGGGTLAIAGAGSLGSGTYSAPITDNGTLNYNSSATETLSGIISGTGTLNYLGTGSLTLSGVNTYSGGTTITSANANCGNGSAFGTGTITISGGTGTGIYETVGSMTFPNAVVLNGGQLHIGGGNSHQVTYSGPITTTVTSATTNAITCDGSTGYNGSGYTYGAAQFINGTLNMGNTTNWLTCSGGNYGICINGSISGSNGVIENTANTLWIAAASNPFAGTIRANAGTVIFYSGSEVNSVTVDMNAADAGSFTFANPCTIGGLTGSRNLSLAGALSIGQGNGSTTYNGNLTNSSSITKIGSGTLTLSGANNITNGLLISAGTLALSGSAHSQCKDHRGQRCDLQCLRLGSAFALGATQILSNSVPGAFINGANNCSAAGATLSLVFDGVTPAFIQTNGTMTLGGSTVIKVNKTGAQLPAGACILIAAAQTGSTGLVAGSLPTPTIAGGGAAGAVSLKIDNFGNLDLVVAGSVQEWNGVTSTSWGTGANWASGVFPPAGSSVLFDANSTNNLATVLDTGYNLASLTLSPSPTGRSPSAA